MVRGCPAAAICIIRGVQPSAQPAASPHRASPRAPIAALTAVCLAAAATVVVLGTRLTFFNDDWYFLLQRPGLESGSGADVLLAPHNSNLVALPAVVYKVLVAVFGLGNQLPFRVVLGASIAALGALVYLYVSARAGRFLGLVAAAILVFLGPAWEDLLFFASIDLVGALAAGVAALVVLDRDGPRAHLFACLLLVCAVSCSNVGIPFVLAGGLAVLMRGRPSRLWVAAIPLVLFGVWWIARGSDQPSHLAGSNAGHLPHYIAQSLGSGLASLTGLNAGTVPATYARGYILIGVAGIALVIAFVRGWRPAPSVLVPVSGGAAFWVLTGLSFHAGREPFASRYQLIDAVFILLIGAHVLNGVRIRRWVLALTAVLAIGVLVSNVAGRLSHGYQFLRDQSGYVKTALGSLEIAGANAPGELQLTDAVARNPYLSGITPGRYLSETRRRGALPRYSAQQIAAATPAQRRTADGVMAAAEGITGARVPGPACTSGQAREAPLPAGTSVVTNRGAKPLVLTARRFAPRELAVAVGLIGPGWNERFVVPRDEGGRPWAIGARATAGGRAPLLSVCQLR